MAPAFVAVEVAGVTPPVPPELLVPGVVEVICARGQRVRLAPPIDARVLKAVQAVFG
uniref:hypothetical protein n=1 Tax=uncultured Sphingomonas sp. TaxID=158754 RepID=UPI0035CC9B77